VGGRDVALGQWDATVAFVVAGRFCSGVLVAPRLVLTAGHCIRDLTPEEDVVVLLGVDALDPVDVASVTNFAPFPEFCGDCTHGRFDLGYLLLEQTVSLPDGFPPLITDQENWDAVMQEGRLLTVIGFGQTADGEPSEEDHLGVGLKREVELELQRFGETGLDFRAGGGGEGTCHGDSGGPAMVQLPDGRYAVAGVLSAGFGGCGEGGLFNVPLPALPWIRDETGFDLLPDGCEDADCLDTSFPEEDGCGCRSDDSTRAWTAWIGGLLVLIARCRPGPTPPERGRATVEGSCRS
jgi:MYXO-CTERM domain-containing protein